MNKGGFSFKRLFGITAAKQRASRRLGIPFTRGGRQRKAGRVLSGKSKDGLFALLITWLFD
jgi:hypothetical protein